MPSENKTPNYGLNQWQGNEYPKRQDFVDDNATIDAQMKENEDAAAAKIPKSLATASDQVLVSSGVGAWIVKTLAQFKAWLGLGSAAYKNESDFETPFGAQAKVDALAGEGNTTTVKAVDDALETHKNANASETGKGHIQLATAEEAVAGTDTAKAVTSAGLKARFASHLIPQSTLHEDVLANTISIGNTEKKAVAVGLKGRTIINLLGSDGDCENTGIWDVANQVTLSLDSTSKAFGDKSLKSIVTSADGEHYIDFYIDKIATKGNYYCFSVYVKPIVGKTCLRCINVGTNTTFLSSDSVSNSSIYSRIFVKGRYLEDTIRFILRIQHLSAAGGALFSGSTEEFNFDGIMVNEITEEEYNDPNYEPPEYVNGNVDVVNPIVGSHGKNLCPSFDKWYIPGGYSLVDSNTIQTSIESGCECKSSVFAVKPNTQYTISADITGPDPNTRISIIWFDKSKAFVLDEWGATVSAPSVVLTSPLNAYYAFIDLITETGTGLKTFSNVQLEEGSAATEYKPYQAKEIQIPYTLRECNGIRDEITKDGKFIRRIGYKVLDGSLDWAYRSNADGLKHVQLAYPWELTSGNYTKVCLKHNNKILTQTINTNDTTVDSIYMDGAPSLIISISNTDSGWGPDYTPTPEEIKAYFYGWRMGAAGDVTTPYNNVGDKAWSKMDYTGGTVTLPTTIADGYTPYRLYFQLAQPEIEDIPPILLPVPPQGSISVGSNIMPLLNYELMDNARAQIDSIMDGLAGITGNIKNKARYTIVIAIYSQVFANDELIPVYWQSIGESTCDGTFNPAYPTRLTVPRGVKKVRVMGSILFSGSTDTNERLMQIRKNGVNIPYAMPEMRASNVSDSQYMALQVASPIISVNEGDYFELICRQKSGAALSTVIDMAVNAANWFYMEVVE